MARLYKPFRARHSELMSQSLSSFLRQDVPASAPRAAVALQRFSPADSGAVAQALPLLLDRAGLASSFSLRSAHVLVKPNLLTATPLACTSPVVVAAVCRWLLDQGARVRVGDSPGFGTATAVARQTGVEEALRPLGLRVESLADPRPLELPLRRGGPVSFGVARVALESDVIFSLPRVKAHSQMRLTLAVKNLFGCVCGLRKALIHTRQGQDPDFFADCIAALWAGLPPGAAVADGLTAMHVTGPSKGQPFGRGPGRGPVRGAGPASGRHAPGRGPGTPGSAGVPPCGLAARLCAGPARRFRQYGLHPAGRADAHLVPALAPVQELPAPPVAGAPKITKAAPPRGARS